MNPYLLIVIAVVFWLLTLNFKPFARCFMCAGKGFRLRVRKKGRKTKAKARKCWLCKGKGRRQRFGSRTVHRIRHNAVTGWRDWRADQ